MTYNKYPKTLAEQLVPILPDGLWSVQEKLDGANARIEYSSDGLFDVLIVGSKNQAKAQIHLVGDTVETVALADIYEPISGLIKYASENFEALVEFFKFYYVQTIYGEWMTKHTINYPQDQYGKFVVFDLVDWKGRMFDPTPLYDILAVLGLKTVVAVTHEIINSDREESLNLAVRRIEELAALDGRPQIEGIVIKRYDLDNDGRVDSTGGRYCYKFVLSQFKEDHKNNTMFPAPKEPKRTEQRLIEHLPDRSLEKVMAGIKAANGGVFTNQLIPSFMGCVWQEFFEEHLIPALQKEKLPVVDTKALKAVLDSRCRDYIFDKRGAA